MDTDMDSLCFPPIVGDRVDDRENLLVASIMSLFRFQILLDPPVRKNDFLDVLINIHQVRTKNKPMTFQCVMVLTMTLY